ncbi:unnamed protein product [Rangifer tarandus platyrhynchus]|uniref:Uncharacterized protein n=1 Tax=Rangifer tarandus platyrhynchus TaxID=3082113 RepID=A0ABN8YHI1_RANTA|nr:unnamed protein product [Rangifer tarandus platyrhynchus]
MTGGPRNFSFRVLTEGFRKEQGVPSEHPLLAASEKGPRSVCPHHPRAYREQRPLHICGPTAPNAHPAAPPSGSSAATPHPACASPQGPGPRGAHRPRGRPPWSRGAGREGCECAWGPPLHDRLGAPAQRPYPAAGGSDRGAEDRARLTLLEAGRVGGRWPLGRLGHAVRGCG